MWQFARAVEGLADACRYLGVPVTGGNVSFYNQTGSTPINPTPVIGVLGVHDDVRRHVNMSFTSDGATLALLGETREEFGGSEWAHVVYGHLGGLPPLVDLAAEAALASVLVQAGREGLLTAAHDLSDGGLSQVLVESCLRGSMGARIMLPGDPFVSLFSESVARAVVAVRPGAESKLAALCEAKGVPVTQIGNAAWRLADGLGPRPGGRPAGDVLDPAGRAPRVARAHPAELRRLRSGTPHGRPSTHVAGRPSASRAVTCPPCRPRDRGRHGRPGPSGRALEALPGAARRHST